MIVDAREISASKSRRCYKCSKDIQAGEKCVKETLERRRDRYGNRYVCLECKEKEQYAAY